MSGEKAEKIDFKNKNTIVQSGEKQNSKVKKIRGLNFQNKLEIQFDEKNDSGFFSYFSLLLKKKRDKYSRR
jgi:hypothetical protein